MHGLQACFYKYIAVAAIRIYAKRGEDAAKRVVGGHALNTHGNYIVDHEKSWNYGIVFLYFYGNPVLYHWIFTNSMTAISYRSLHQWIISHIVTMSKWTISQQ